MPPYPGITSAMGLLTTDLKYDSMRTQFQVSGARRSRPAERRPQRDGGGPRQAFRRRPHRGAKSRFMRTGDLRYVGQGYELQVPLPDGEITAGGPAGSLDRLSRDARREYGHASRRARSRSSTSRVSGIGRMPKLKNLSAPAGGSLEQARSARALACFASGASCNLSRPTFYQRTLLPVDERFPGPAIVLQKDSTTVVPPGWTANVDSSGNIILIAREPHDDISASAPPTGSRATRVDPITAAVIHGALENIAIEMGHKLMRMSYSSIIRESEDFGAALTDAEGGSSANAR